ncbi:MAG: DUF4252 domain-containing protein [Bacteroidales bacterium]|nr:DUF4252 domain-containing protein [Bacteroidales bacterium]
MRKIFITIIGLLTIVGLIAPTQASAIDHGRRVTMLMKEYSSNTDFQLINLGRIGLSIVKAAMRQSADKDTRELLDLMRDVKQVSIASYEDCEASVKRDFESRLSKVLKKEFLLVEAKDGNDKVQIFAVPTDDGGDIKNLIINAPGSGALICVSGLIKTGDVAGFLETHSK